MLEPNHFAVAIWRARLGVAQLVSIMKTVTGLGGDYGLVGFSQSRDRDAVPLRGSREGQWEH